MFELIYQVNMVDLGSLCSFSKKTKMTSFIKDMNTWGCYTKQGKWLTFYTFFGEITEFHLIFVLLFTPRLPY